MWPLYKLLLQAPFGDTTNKALWEHDSFTIQLLRDYGGSAYMSYCLHAEINCLQRIKSGTLETGA